MGLFTRKKTANTTQSLPRTSAGTAERIRNILGIRKLDSMPVQAAHAFQLASDPKAKGEEFVKIIEADEAFSARVIKVANSVYFFRGTKATDITNAVANIGLEELRCLISATMLKSLLRGKSRIRESVWANSVATAIACRELAHTTAELTSGSAFLCGLLHDVGKLIMVQRGGKLYEKVYTLIASEEISTVDAEERVFELNHVDVGKWIAEQWNFPEHTVLAIAMHHNPWNKSTSGKLSAPELVKAADTISHAARIGHLPEMRLLSERAKFDLPKAQQYLGMTAESMDSFIETLKSSFERDFSLYQPEGK